MAPRPFLQLKVTLLGVDPPVWRRLLVPADATFAELHGWLQDAMGWDGDHLHAFELTTGGDTASIGEPSDWSPDTIDERSAKVLQHLKTGTTVLYRYDLGDDWCHGIVLERRLHLDEPGRVPQCTDGARACPPEDCGGVYGYEDLLAILRGETTGSDAEDQLEWLGPDFDPERFDTDLVRFRLPVRR